MMRAESARGNSDREGLSGKLLVSPVMIPTDLKAAGIIAASNKHY
jgi:hypothetical protein